MEAQPVMDLAAAMERFDGDQDLFLTLAEMFLERSPAALAAIQTALADKNLPMLAKEAHKLKDRPWSSALARPWPLRRSLKNQPDSRP
jgi:HPt (histidine-containing phosphotransfer) domain-containing protein